MYNTAASLDRNADRRPDEIAVIFGERITTHRQLNDDVHVLAGALRALGIGTDDVVAIIMGNCTEFLEVALAINGAGAIFMPLNTRLAPAEWSYILRHANCRAAVVGPGVVPSLPELRAACTQLELVIGLADEDGVDVSFDKLLTEYAGAAAPFAARDSIDVSRLMYTSGTTARPKGVPITYENVLWKIFDHVLEFGLTAQDRTVLAGPMYHVGAYDLPGTGTLYAGGSVVILPRFDARELLTAVQQHRATNVWLAPAMFNAMMQLPDLDSFDTACLRFITNGGEKMPTSLIERFEAAFPNTWLADAFGMTETVSGDTILDQRHVLSKLGSVGKPVMHVDAKIVRDDDSTADPDEIGELLLRGPKVFRGYWNDAEATERAFSDGWFRTGDLGHIDADGYLYIDDRKKDMIVSGGENIATPEIERVLYLHPAVSEAAVVGMSDARWGQVPKAVVVLKPGAEASAEELMSHCAKQLAKYKVPKHVEFVDALPRTASGKVMKRQLL